MNTSIRLLASAPDTRRNAKRVLAGCVFAALSALLTNCGSGGGGDGASVTPPTTSACAGATSQAAPADVGPAWFGFGRDAQHTAQGAVATQPLKRLVWRTPVDVAPSYSADGSLLIHYGSPVITAKNTVIVPVKTGGANGFRVEARSGADGSLRWTLPSNYLLPSHNWVPSYNVVLTPGNRLYAPTSGGGLLYRDDVDTATPAALCAGTPTAYFYPRAADATGNALNDANIIINTPLTADAQGNVFFGFIVTGPTSANLASGVARLGADGVGRWVSASAAAGDAAITKVATNSAPALSADGRTLYVAVNNTASQANGYLLALDSVTLATRGKAALLDPQTGSPAWISDDGTASPTVGPDGDVYFGVLESNPPGHNLRGWLLHFDATLAQTRLPGAFGWDDTASIVPASMVPSYTGRSSYLLMSKYNNYGGIGTGDGKNRVAILDPNQAEADPVTGIAVMNEVLTQLGPTADPDYRGGVKEWCINTAAVDPLTQSILVNSEDGTLYRWNLASNTFSEKIVLDSGFAESYTPTAIGPDGTVYSINNAVLFAVGR